TTAPATPVPCSITITSFNIAPRADRSGVVVSWSTKPIGDCRTVLGHLSENYENAPPGNFQLYHQHTVGFSDPGHADPWPPFRCGGAFNVDFLLSFEQPSGVAVANVIKTVPFTGPAVSVEQPSDDPRDRPPDGHGSVPRAGSGDLAASAGGSAGD